ncbi:MAG: hypothetical protein V3V70_08785 [Candidatus Scalindua sp.]
MVRVLLNSLEIPKNISKLEKLNKGEIDADTSCQIEKQILEDEFDDPEFLEFAMVNFVMSF